MNRKEILKKAIQPNAINPVHFKYYEGEKIVKEQFLINGIEATKDEFQKQTKTTNFAKPIIINWEEKKPKITDDEK